MESVFNAFYIACGKNVNKGDVTITNKILFCKTFSTNKLMGSFFSCIYRGELRIHAILNEETNAFNEEISELIEKSMKKVGMSEGVIWLRNSSQNLVTHLCDQFVLTPKPKQFFYHSTEYIMNRDKFKKVFDPSLLDVKPYEEIHIDKYLALLHDAMSFFFPPEDFFHNKEQYLKEFMEFKNKNAFEAFWKEDKLVGLYWIDGREVDTMAVASDFQRSGYGSEILTRAIEMVFSQNPETTYALLYAVGWNAKAHNFYKKYGMEKNNYYEVPYTEN